MPGTEQDAVVAAVMKSVDKAMKGVSIGVLGRPQNFIDTGNYALNWILSGKPVTGGLPCTRVVEIFGDPSTGKSLIIYGAIAEVQKQMGYGVLDDSEGSYVDVFGASLGVDNSKLGFLESLTIEDHFEAAGLAWQGFREKIGPDLPILIALDSLAHLSSRFEMEKGFEKEDMKKAKVIKKAMRLLRPKLIVDEHTAYIIANHKIATFDAYHPSTTPGGGGVKFLSSARLDLTLRAKLREGGGDTGRVIGGQTHIKAVKNKVVSPFRECTIEFFFKTGVVRESGLYGVAQDAGVVVKSESKGWYRMEGVDVKFQRATFYEKYVDKALELMEAQSELAVPVPSDESTEIDPEGEPGGE